MSSKQLASCGKENKKDKDKQVLPNIYKNPHQPPWEGELYQYIGRQNAALFKGRITNALPSTLVFAVKEHSLVFYMRQLSSLDTSLGEVIWSLFTGIPGSMTK